jgi:ribosomal protein S18 acetylase RimI-like enzyme
MKLAANALRLRPASVADAQCVETLYAATRTDLRTMVSDSTIIDLLISMQHQAQIVGYRTTYPDAEYLMIEWHEEAIGRVVINSVAASLRIVDISVLPAARRQGHASAVLRCLQERAAAAGQELCLSVHQDNPDARRLYLALGFAVEAQDAVCAQLRWRA